MLFLFKFYCVQNFSVSCSTRSLQIFKFLYLLGFRENVKIKEKQRFNVYFHNSFMITKRKLKFSKKKKTHTNFI